MVDKSLIRQISSSVLVFAVNCHFINAPNLCIHHLLDGPWGHYEIIQSLKFNSGMPTILAVTLCPPSYQISTEILSHIRKQLLKSTSNWLFTNHPTIWRYIIWAKTNEFNLTIRKNTSHFLCLLMWVLVTFVQERTRTGRFWEEGTANDKFGSKTKASRESWGKLHNKGLRDSYSTHNVVRITQSRRFIRMRKVGSTGKTGYRYQVLFEKTWWKGATCPT